MLNFIATTNYAKTHYQNIETFWLKKMTETLKTSKNFSKIAKNLWYSSVENRSIFIRDYEATSCQTLEKVSWPLTLDKIKKWHFKKKTNSSNGITKTNSSNAKMAVASNYVLKKTFINFDKRQLKTN